MPTPYMLEHRRRPRAHDTYTGGAPCLPSSFFEIGDFGKKDESGNALLVRVAGIAWGEGPLDDAKVGKNFFWSKFFPSD